MTAAKTIKSKAKIKSRKSARSSERNAESSVPKKRGVARKNSPWKAILILLIFAGLVAYMFSPNVPNSQRSGSQSSSDSGFAKTLAK